MVRSRPQAEHTVLDSTTRYRPLPAPAAALHTQDDVLALAEQWLQASCPAWLMGWRNITNATNERGFIRKCAAVGWCRSLHATLVS